MRQQQILNCLGMAVAVSVLVAHPLKAQVTQVTSVQLNPTASGIKVILETVDGSLQVLTSRYGQTFVANIPGAQLRLPEDNTFRRDNPAEGIAAVTVTSPNANSIRVTVTGRTGIPTAELVQSDCGLVISVTPAADTTVQSSTPTPLSPDSEQTGEPVEQAENLPNSEQNQEQLEQVEPETPEFDSNQEPDETAEEDEPIEIVVIGEQETGYRVPNATTGTRTDTPLRDIPQSIQVVPQQVLEDQQVIRLTEALRNVSGVSTDDVFAGTIDRINIRGFQQDVFLRDNFRQSQFSLRETANLERIEVLKGPAAVLYGNLEPGGVVNLVTKKPLSEPFYSAELLVGSYGFYRPNIDLSGPLDSDRTLLYRLNAV